MHHIRPWLYIGNFRESNDRGIVHAYQINAVLQLAQAVNLPNVTSIYVAVDDGVPLPKEKLAEGVAFIRAQKAAGKTVLSACGAGISRSVTFAISALKEEEGLSLTDAYFDILKIHPNAMPHPMLWESMRIYYGEKVNFQTMMDMLWEKRKQGK